MHTLLTTTVGLEGTVYGDVQGEAEKWLIKPSPMSVFLISPTISPGRSAPGSLGYGAEMIKTESPAGGDPVQQIGPLPNDIAHPEKSGMFLHLNMNKKSITLDLSTLSGQSIFKKLVKRYRHCGGELPTRHPGLLGAIVQRVSPF